MWTRWYGDGRIPAGAVMREVFAQKGTGDETVYEFFSRRSSEEVS